MSFDALLEMYLNRVPGCRAIFLMGMDGLAVAQVVRDPSTSGPLEAFSAEYTSLVQKINESIQRLAEHQAMEHFHVTDTTFILCRFLNPQYYVLMYLQGPSLLGFARYQLRRLCEHLAKEIAAL